MPLGLSAWAALNYTVRIIMLLKSLLRDSTGIRRHPGLRRSVREGGKCGAEAVVSALCGLFVGRIKRSRRATATLPDFIYFLYAFVQYLFLCQLQWPSDKRWTAGDWVWIGWGEPLYRGIYGVYLRRGCGGRAKRRRTGAATAEIYGRRIKTHNQ